jgi:hypothetical protein
VKRFLLWCRDAGIRAVKTFGQAAGGAIVIDQATPLHSNFTFALQIGLASAALSILNNLAALNLGAVPPVVTIVNQTPPVVADIDDPLDGLDDSDVGPAGDQLDPPK